MSDKRAIIAEALLDGADPRERLLASGASPKTADYEIGRAEKDPLFQLAQRLQRQVTKRDWTLQMHSRLAAVRPEGFAVPRIDQIEPERFFTDFYAANRPVVLTGSGRSLARAHRSGRSTISKARSAMRWWNCRPSARRRRRLRNGEGPPPRHGADARRDRGYPRSRGLQRLLPHRL